MKKYLILFFVFFLFQNNSSFAFGFKPLHRTKRPNVHLSMGATDFYYSFDTQTISFKNSGTLKTSVITTTLPAGPFTIDSDGCHGTELLPGQTCDISIMYFHPGSYPQNRLLTISGPGFSDSFYLNSCDPMLC
jgi:hypothetical protein